jgi:hypothetical protein
MPGRGFASLTAGDDLGRHPDRAGADEIARWLSLYPDQAVPGALAPPGLVTALAMRAFMHLVDVPAGSLHAGMRIRVTALPAADEAVVTTIRCVGKEEKRGRYWATFNFDVSGADGRAVAEGTNVTILPW